MVNIAIATDNIRGKSSDSKTLNSVVEILKSKGHTVTSYGVGPNKVQRSMLSKSNSCDMMIQIAGGKCLGTLVDFYTGIKNGYYHAKTGGFMYYDCWNPSWKAHRAHDDRFSKESALAPYKGKTLPEIYPMMKPYCFYGYGNNANELVTTFLNNYNGSGDNIGTNTNASESGGGSNVLELIKQVLNPYDEHGIELLLDGDTVKIRRSDPKDYIKIHENQILNNSLTFEDYDANTPNTFTGKNGETLKDQRLIDKYGIVKGELKDNTYTKQAFQILKRGHGHSIDFRIPFNPNYKVGKWVKLTLPSLNINDELYYITKTSLEDEVVLSLSLEPAPPSIYQEIQETENKDGQGSISSGSVNKGRICTLIEKVGGIPITDPLSLYNNFKKMHYKLYYNDRYNFETELSRIEKGLTLNCTDFAQVYMKAYQEAGFKDEIRIVRGVVRCTDGSYGHVWCQIKQGGNWVHVDPSAAAAHNYDWGKLICTRGATVTNINPAFAANDTGGG